MNAGKTVVLIFFVGVFIVPTARACSCPGFGSAQEAYEKSDAVFVARVKGVFPASGENNEVIKLIRLDVERSLKGMPPGNRTVWTLANEFICGYTFEAGQRYLIYANDTPNAGTQYLVSLCSRTALVEEAYDDLVALDFEEAFAEPERQGGCGGLTNVAALQGMFFIFLWIGFRRRRHR